MNTESPLFRHLTMILATWFGCGKSPRAPGTVGTIGALPLAWALSYLQPMGYMLATITLTVIAILVSHFHEAFTGKHDSKEIVIDEVVGFLVTMTWVPFTWTYVLAGFLLFRFFDILKPFPISYVDRQVKGGVGTVGDDLIAGIFASIILQVLLQKGWLA